MRYTIWEKDDFFKVGATRMDMDPAVVDLPVEADVMWMYDTAKPPHGKVTDIRLEDGEITGEVEFYDPAITDDVLKELRCRFGGYYTSIRWNDERTQVTSARLTAISVMLLEEAPGYKERTKHHDEL